jgi:hypothetical protein
MVDDFPLNPGQKFDERQRLKRIYQEERAEREECDDADSASSSSDEDRTPKRLPPGYRIDYFTKKPRKLRAKESRGLLRRRYERMVEKSAEERQWGYWEKGDSAMDFE